MLLRVPGLGPETVRKLLSIRRTGRIHRLEDSGLRGKRLDRARKYIVLD